MTTSMDNRIDELIARVKKHGAMSAFAFIPGYPAHKTPNPVTKYTVAVTNREVKIGRCFISNRMGADAVGKLYDVELCLRVYAPERSSGAALQRASSLLMNALQAQDSEREIVSLSLSDIGFDTSSRTEYRDVIARLSMAIEEAAE